MALRQTSHRLIHSSTLHLPKRPSLDSTSYEVAYHDVYMGVLWLHEQTDVDIAHLYEKLQEPLDIDQLREISKIALEHLFAMSGHFSPSNYDAIYQHLNCVNRI